MRRYLLIETASFFFFLVSFFLRISRTGDPQTVQGVHTPFEGKMFSSLGRGHQEFPGSPCN